MPLNGSDVGSKPSGTTASPNSIIESSKYNSTIDDIYTILNTVRTVAKGFTGASTAAGAVKNFGIGLLADKSAGYTGLVADLGKIFRFTDTATLALDPAATLGNGWWCIVWANGGAVTIDPNSSEQVNGSSTFALADGDFALLACTGSAFRAVRTPANASTLKTILALTTGDISGLGNVATRAVASFSEYNSATSTRALGNESVWADLAVLTDDTTIAVDMNAGYDFGGASNAALALGGDRTLGAPSNVRNGKKGILWFTASGSTRTLTLNAAWVLATGVETGPYSITTSQTLGVAYVCRGTNVVVTAIVRVG